MAEESYSFTTARARLEEIVTQVRKKDTSLEKSLDLLEEGVRLANACTEQIDHVDWATTPAQSADGAQAEAAEGESAAFDGALVVEDTAVVEDIRIVDGEGTVIAEAVEAVEYAEVQEFVDADEAWPEDFVENALEPTDPSAEER